MGHRHEGARHAGLGERDEQLPGTRPPRHPADDPLDDLVHRQVDDPLHGQVQTGLLQAARSLVQRASHEGGGQVLRPGAAVLDHQPALDGVPQGLGVHEGAVHVPQDGARQAAGTVVRGGRGVAGHGVHPIERRRRGVPGGSRAVTPSSGRV
ncbi:Uncharacterised protein [Streptococcus pneumoniae]|nr:Uncharacterised protein [Streptococcus pneumoniae]